MHSYKFKVTNSGAMRVIGALTLITVLAEF